MLSSRVVVAATCACASILLAPLSVADGGVGVCAARTGAEQTLGPAAPYMGVVVGPGGTVGMAGSSHEFRDKCSSSLADLLPGPPN